MIASSLAMRPVRARTASLKSTTTRQRTNCASAARARLNEVTPFPGADNVTATTGALRGLKTITGTRGPEILPRDFNRDDDSRERK